MLLRRSVFLFFLLSPYISASDAWRIPTNNWTLKDFERLLMDSPWVLSVNATMDDPADKPEYATGVPTEISQAGIPTNAKLGSTQRWDGAVNKNRMGHLATIPVTVRWDSAAIVRNAMDHAHDPTAAVLNTAAPENFIITVMGLLPAKIVKTPATLQQKSSSDDSAGPRSAEEDLEWFMANSHLLAKGMTSLQPQNVKIDSESGVVHLFFKRSEDLLNHKRDVFFVTRFGAMSVQAKFRTKDMTVNGQPDL